MEELITERNGSIIVPCFVNAHTHTEWNRGKCLAERQGMTAWIERVLAFDGGRGDGKVAEEAAVERTLGYACEDGWGLTGDHGAAFSAVGRGLAGRWYREILRADENINGGRGAALDALTEEDGMAPHAVHTVEADLWTRLEGRDLFLSVHAGESPEERELYDSGTGSLADLLLKRGFGEEHIASLKGRSPVKILDEAGLLGPRTLLVHALWLSAEDFDLIAERKAHIALCPVSNRDIGVGFMRSESEISEQTTSALRAIADRNISCAMGTDSEVSASSMSLLENARLLYEFGICPDKILEMLWNAAAIGKKVSDIEGKLRFEVKRDSPAHSILEAKTYARVPS